MKNNIKVLLSWLLAFLCFQASAQVTYTVQKILNAKKAYSFTSKIDFGIRANSSLFNTTNKINVKIEAKSNNYFPYYDECSESNIMITDPVLLYSGTINASTGTNYDKGTGFQTNYYKRASWCWYCFDPCGALISTADVNYIKSSIQLADVVINSTRPDGWFAWGDQNMDVTITATVYGDAKLSDLEGVRFPGLPDILPGEFVKKDYITGHDCNGSNSGVCFELNKVRSIPDVNATDVVVQAHRGVWGKPDSSQENTIGAMTAAFKAGYKILESDIMPVNVQDGGLYIDGNSGIPQDLACFHDFLLTRYTSETNNANRIYNRSRTQLLALSLKKPRSETLGAEKIMFFDQLIDYAVANNLIVCVDMKNLESKGQGGSCTELCGWQTPESKSQSLYHNLKFAINNTADAKLKNIAIKTYANYNDLKLGLTTGPNAVSEAKFNKVLWAPLLAPGTQWETTGGGYDAKKIQKFLDDWFAHNETVLYYETNFFNDNDGKSSVMLDSVFCFRNAAGQTECVNIMEYIYKMTGRRAGIFSEEPVGGKGAVNRWGKWNIKNTGADRRGDHLWLLKWPYFKHAVITTDRPDQWDALKN